MVASLMWFKLKEFGHLHLPEMVELRSPFFWIDFLVKPELELLVIGLELLEVQVWA
jgi:hypothetical protein